MTQRPSWRGIRLKANYRAINSMRHPRGKTCAFPRKFEVKSLYSEGVHACLPSLAREQRARALPQCLWLLCSGTIVSAKVTTFQTLAPASWTAHGLAQRLRVPGRLLVAC